VTTVSDGTGAAAAGVQSGDEFVRIGDAPIASVEDVIRAMTGRYAGDAVEVVVKRGSKTVPLTITLGTRD
jgi:S1-C subfamily serine protease